jgi:LPS export ABC transporter protein LptC
MPTQNIENTSLEEKQLNPLNSSRGALDQISRAPRVRLMQFFKRYRLYLSVVAFAVCFVLLLRWLNDEVPVTKTKQTYVSPLQIEDLRSFSVRQEGKKVWEISATKVEISPRNDQTIAQGVSKAIFFRDGEPFLNLKAPKVRLSNVTNNLEATGGVFASGPDQFSFSTPIVRWLNKTKLIQCPQAVQATLRAFEIDSPGLLYSWDSGELVCKQKVELRTEGAVLRSNMLKANVKSRKIELGGGVELVFDPKTANFQQQLAPSTEEPTVKESTE